LTAFAADPNALGVVAAVAERRGTLGADPLVAALVASLLLLEALLEFLDELFQATQALDLGFFLFAQAVDEFRAQPFLRDQDVEEVLEGLQILEIEGEGA